MIKVFFTLLLSTAGFCHDTLRYNLSWGSQFNISPGESMLMVYKLYSGLITGINIPIYEWGTGDQQLTIEIYKLQYPHDSNGNIYPTDSVDLHGWLGGWHDGIHHDSLFVDSSDTYNVWNQFPNNEGACNYTDIIPNSYDPLGERLWPPFTQFLMLPIQYPDIISGGTNFWIDIPYYEQPHFECDENYIGILVRSIGSGGGDDPTTGFLYADGNLLNIDFRPFLKFYNPCNGTSGEGGWHIRQWVMNWGLSFEYFYDRPPIWQINCLPEITLSTDSMEVCGYMLGWDTYCNGIQDSAELRYSIDGAQTWNNKEMSIKDTIWDDLGYHSLEWEAYIPGQQPGTQIIWKIVLLSTESDYESPSYSNQYSIFQPVEQNLFYYNTNDFAHWIQNYYMNNIDFPSDFWGGAYYPPGLVELFQNYDVILEITGSLPSIISIDTLIASGFFDESGHAYILTGDNWLGFQTNGQDTAYGPGSFQYEILGIDSFTNDINYEFAGDLVSVSMLLAVENDPISGDLFNFLGDSLALYYDPNYELGFSNRLDGVFPTEGTEVAYWGLTGVVDENGLPSPAADTIPVGIYRQLYNGIPIVFLAFDPLAVNTKSIGDLQSGYHWIGYSQYGPLPSAVRWIQDMLDTDSEEDLDLIPSVFQLYQNYPNPFNPITTISYDLPVDTYVRVSIIDLLGREVQVIVDRYNSAGVREVQFDATNLPSSVYFYRIETEEQVITKKMVILK